MDSKDTLRMQIEELKEQGRYSEAAELLIQFQKEYPDDVWGFYEFATITIRHLNKARYGEARIAIELALKLDPDSLNLKRLLFDTLVWMKGEEPNVDEMFNELVDKLYGKDNLRLLYTYASFLSRSKRHEQEEQIYLEILRKSPNEYGAQLGLARCYSVRDAELAGKYYENLWNGLQQSDPGKRRKHRLIDIALRYSGFLRKQNRIADAYTLLNEAESVLKTQTVDLIFEKAVVLVKMGNHSEAYELLKKINIKRPKDRLVLNQMGVCLWAMGKLDEALEVYKRELEIDPNSPYGWTGIGITLSEMGKHQEAREIFLKVQNEFPDYATKFGIQERFRELEQKIVDQQIELEEAKKFSYLGKMASAVAHEINQPVGIIRAATSAGLSDLDEEKFQFENVKPLLERIWTQTERLNAIINNFRRFARGDRTQREIVDINELIARTINTFEVQFTQRNIALETNLNRSDDKPLRVWANPYQLEEVLINLMTNAREAVEDKETAKVWVRTNRRKDGKIEMIVEDNGSGIVEEYRDQMFVPFVSTKSSEKGTGLGLHISRRIIDEFGGRLYYQDREGGGARFTVELPALDSERNNKNGTRVQTTNRG
ncbi:MAG: tetratricopeptide repeat protein [Anaerolineae bacterium]